MRFFLLLVLSLASLAMYAQDSWKVCLDKKTVLSASAESEEKNIIKISLAELNKYKTFVISYKETEPQKDWKRTIMAYDEKDKELSKQTGNKFLLKSAALKTLLQTSKIVKIFTWSLPTDPNLAAQVRVRRVHLCTLVLE